MAKSSGQRRLGLAWAQEGANPPETKQPHQPHPAEAHTSLCRSEDWAEAVGSHLLALGEAPAWNRLCELFAIAKVVLR